MEQQDATKNSIAMVAQANFKHKELQGYNGSQLQENYLQRRTLTGTTSYLAKRGVCITKQSYLKGTATRTKWDVDLTHLSSLKIEIILTNMSSVNLK